MRRAEKSVQPEQTPPRKAPHIVERKTQTGAVISSAESREGRTKALVAAGMGKKNPQMNNYYEVVPYEVQFGPKKIGS